MIGGARLGFDARATQNVHYADRGIGRYVAQLALALERVSPGAVDAFILDGRDGANAPSGVLDNLPHVASYRSARQLHDWGAGNAIFHVASPFEELPLDLLWPRLLRRADAAFVATAFDLIPLVFEEHYLHDARTRGIYMDQCNRLRAADIVFCISEATAADVHELLGVPDDRLVVIGGGVDAFFSLGNDGQQGALSRLAREHSGIRPGFIFYTGGMDFRKNVAGAIEAYALLDPVIRSEHQMVITCSLRESDRDDLRALATRLGVAEQLILTGYVTDEMLRDLYRACGLFVFPSIYEGFGLPIAEARACGAPVIAGDNSSLRELVPDPAARFDATDSRAIARHMETALRDDRFRRDLREQALQQDLSWDHVAEKALAGYERATGVLEQRQLRPARRRRLALVTPWAPDMSGVAEYARLLVNETTTRYDVDIVVDGVPSDFQPAPHTARLVALDGFDITSAWRRYDRIIYQLGNSEFHARALDMLARVPGEVIAHDVRLTGLYWWRGVNTSKPTIGDEVARMYGHRVPGRLHGADHLAAEDAERFGIWMLRDVIDHATRIWVHSQAAATTVRVEADALGLPCDVQVLPFPYPQVVAGPPHNPGTGVRHVVSFGVVGPSKGCSVLIRAMALLRSEGMEVALTFAGPAEPTYLAELTALAERLGISDVVAFTGPLEVDHYSEWHRRAAIAVQLRTSTNGEGSLTVAECQAAGVPVVVSDVGWMGELPSTTVAKVSAPATPEAVAAVIRGVLTDDRRRESLISAGRMHATTHGVDRTADTLLGSGSHF